MTDLLKVRIFLLGERILLQQQKYKQDIPHWLLLALDFLWFGFRGREFWLERAKRGRSPELGGARDTLVWLVSVRNRLLTMTLSTGSVLSQWGSCRHCFPLVLTYLDCRLCCYVLYH